MENGLNKFRILAGRVFLIVVALSTASCGVQRMLPFGRDEGRVPVPENATQYRCNDGKSFYLRMLADGDAWFILPQREFRLAKAADGAGRRFSNGRATLDLSTDQEGTASFNDGPEVAFVGCKLPAKE